MKKTILTVILLILHINAFAALTVGNIPKVKTGGTTPSLQNSIVSESTGAITVGGTISATNLSGTNTGDQTTITGNAGTATALAANGANCSSGNSPLGVDASGAVEGCFDVATQTELNAITLSTLTDVNTTTATAGNVLIADGTDFESVTLAGDATINGAGFITLSANSVYEPELAAIDTASDGECLSYDSVSNGFEWVTCGAGGGGYSTIQDETSGLTQRTTVNFTGAGVSCVDNSGSSRTDCTISGGGATALSDLTDVNTSTATAGNLLIADGTDFESMNIQGDATLNGAGFINIQTIDNALTVGGSGTSTFSGPIVATSFNGLAINSATATAGRILVADGTDFESMAMQGSCTMNGAGFITCSPTGSSAYATIQDEGSGLTQRTILDFTGTGVSCADSGGSKTQCTISGGGASQLSDLSDVNTVTATSGNILIAGGSQWESMALSGDATISATGVITLANNSLALSELSDVNTTTATAGRLLIADGTDFESMALAGDVTINGAGFATITPNSIANMQFTGTKPKKRVFLSATAGFCLTTAGCADATKSETTTNDVNYFGAAFDGATDENWQTTFTLPENYDGSTIIAAVEWTGTHSASSTVRWCVKAMSITDDDVLDTAFGTEQCVDDDTTATGDFQRTSDTSEITISGSPIGGDRIWLQISRDANHANDDNNADAQLLGVWINFGVDQFSTEE